MKRSNTHSNDSNVYSVKNTKRIRLDDTLDPVEKLLSLSNDSNDQDFLFDEQDNFDLSNINEEFQQYNELTINFTKILNDNLINYYKQSNSFIPLEYNHNNFNSNIKVQEQPPNRASSVPFFRSVNFNPKPKVHIFDELISLDPKETSVEEDQDPNSPGLTDDSLSESESELESRKNSQSDDFFSGKVSNDLPIGIPKELISKNWVYRQSNCLNLSNFKPDYECKILNDNSILSGNASQMIGSSKFLINDFFL